MTVTVDAAGISNGLYPGTDGGDRRLLIGVRTSDNGFATAGAYYGILLGVMLAISLLRISQGAAPFRQRSHRLFGRRRCPFWSFPS